MSEIRQLLEESAKQTGPVPSGSGSSSSSDLPAPTLERAPVDSPLDEKTTESVDTKGSKPRDEKGRFAPAPPKPAETLERPGKEAEPESTKPAQIPAPVESPSPPARALKPPQSWRPQAREAFASLAPHVQDEVLRRETEMNRALEEAAQARKLEARFREVLSPYEGMIRAEGTEPLAAVQSLLQTAQALRTAPPTHKAQLVAQLVKTYGVPLEALDAALAGTAPPSSDAQSFDVQGLQQRVKEEILQELQARQQKAWAQKAQSEWEAFAAKEEFAEDVREDMADLLEVAARRGRVLSLEDAYTRAVAMSPELSAVLQQRQKAAQAGNAQASTQRAKAAASSLKPQPLGAVPEAEEGDSLRGALQAAWRDVSRR